MSELDDIKARAAEYAAAQLLDGLGKEPSNRGHTIDELWSAFKEMRDDLDRAIAIAEHYAEIAGYNRIEFEAKVNAQRDEARAAALALRDELFGDSHDWSMEYIGSHYGGQEAKAEKRLAQLKADTEWLEQYR